MESFAEYLEPTCLCDFDRAPEIKSKVQELTQDISDKRQRFDNIYRFVKELPYVLEDWDIRASHTLHKGCGMCSGKSNLLVAMCRSVLIPARYRIFKIKAEGRLWQWITRQNSRLAAEMGDPLPENDHVSVEVYLDEWTVHDPSRDTAFEQGLIKLGISLDRKLASDPDNVLILASIDEWAAKRQQVRRFRENRESIFHQVNEQFERIRLPGKG